MTFPKSGGVLAKCGEVLKKYLGYTTVYKNN